MTCEIDGCSKPKRKRGWCEMHYSRYKAHGTPHAPGRRSAGTACFAPECAYPPIAKGQCRAHYYANKQFRESIRSGKALVVSAKTIQEAESSAHTFASPEHAQCKIEGCISPTTARGWCGSHYQRWRRFGDPEFVPPEADKRCKIEGCQGVTNARGLCGRHYYRWQKYGDPEATGIRVSPKLKAFPMRKCLTCGSDFDPGISIVRKYCGRTCRPSRTSMGVQKRNTVEKLGNTHGWVCHLCDLPVLKSLYWPNGQAGSVDHILPVFHGGNDDFDNLALAHLTCNTARGSKLIS